LKDLLSYKDIIFKPADKGLGMVIMEKNKYDQLILDVVQDKNTYKQLHQDIKLKVIGNKIFADIKIHLIYEIKETSL
jgi:hypothetical protein